MVSTTVQLVPSHLLFERPFNEKEIDIDIRTEKCSILGKDDEFPQDSDVFDDVVNSFFGIDDDEELEESSEALLEHLCSSTIFEAENATTLIIRKLESGTYEEHVCGIALEVLSHCHRQELENSIKGIVRQCLLSENDDLSFSAISVLPNFPLKTRAAFQHMIMQLVADPNVPQGIREAAYAETVGYQRKHRIR